MRLFRIKTPMCKLRSMLAWAGFFVWFTWLGGTGAVGQVDTASRATFHAQPQVIAIDEAPFELQYPTREDDTPGILKYGGYAERRVIVRQSTYRGNTGEATVEVVEHPPHYAYVKHDFLGALFHAIKDQESKKRKDAGKIVIPVEYIDWQTIEPTNSYTICVLCISARGAYHGIAGWYSESGEGVTTVMLRFGAPGGLPRAVIDKLLHEYPSSIRGTVPSIESWESDDIAKWTALLQTRANEEVILNVGSTHLRRYDPGAFGLMEAWNKRSDSVALNDAVGRSIERMKSWFAEREKTKRKGPQP